LTKNFSVGIDMALVCLSCTDRATHVAVAYLSKASKYA